VKCATVVDFVVQAAMCTRQAPRYVALIIQALRSITRHCITRLTDSCIVVQLMCHYFNAFTVFTVCADEVVVVILFS
jgi:hypothetical protein